MFITSSCIKCLNGPETEPESAPTFNKPQIVFAIELILASGAITAAVLGFLAMSNVNLGALNALSQISPNALQGMFYAGAGIIAVNTFVAIITACKRDSTLRKRADALKIALDTKAAEINDLQNKISTCETSISALQTLNAEQLAQHNKFKEDHASTESTRKATEAVKKPKKEKPSEKAAQAPGNSREVTKPEEKEHSREEINKTHISDALQFQHSGKTYDLRKLDEQVFKAELNEINDLLKPINGKSFRG